jgi:hypothetical protein
MKIYKLFFLILLTIVFSCSSDNSDEIIQNKSIETSLERKGKDLSEDPNFINLVIEMESFKTEIKQVIANNNLSVNAVESKLSNLISLNLDYQAQMDSINNIFNTNVSAIYIEHDGKFNNYWPKIEDAYPNLDEPSIADAYLSVLNKMETGGGGPGGGSIGCSWKYSLCVVAVGATAILCHSGCSAGALATTAGFGIPACVWLCGTIQVAGSVACFDEFCP